ncbi:16S rRNA (cytidine(1402)-2'-O)-methyltransferase [Lactococcus termiticola]|uniref:Ribosomal RNA small subunit methyltransferase I n=1 Tax=Lactococcus termiticola TaxID=2169526 RepID=A0A2R5HEF9_9LACT|nr:16S rRNA (cytidine(1402)-2'-O)-methyltransferase [Lactococcus termiticola]GBG96474.1 16S rRNA methyltransferase [Lactococcus termiticola]
MTASIQKSFKSQKASGKLFLVPTPIGNMQDMTLRALETLKTVELIAAEDTRNTQKLLNHFDIKVGQESFHEHNAKEKIPKLLDILKSGRSIAQVSDAGMPSISDPGQDLVKAAIQEDIDVVALPGPSAGITALIASGLVPQPHIFYGFLPRKASEQKKFFESKRYYPETQIFYESPFRLGDTLKNMQAIYGDREAVLVRELTKIYEEYRRGSISALIESLSTDLVKGECLLIVSGFSGEVPNMEEEALSPLEEVQSKIDAGMKPNQAIKEVAKKRDLVRQELYQAYHDL